MVVVCEKIMNGNEFFIFAATTICFGLADASWLISGLRSFHKDKFNGLAAIFTNVALLFQVFGESDGYIPWWGVFIFVISFSGLLIFYFIGLIENLREQTKEFYSKNVH